ncbi:Protein kinase domain-containing protein [Balamuthia mandrillaris]
MSPELIVGDGYDQKTDIWSLGMTILELAEPFHPFFSQEPLSAVFQIVSGPPPQLTRKEEWSQHFLEFLNLCLDKDPQQRPGATQLLQHQFLNMRPRTNSTYLFASQSESKQTPREKLEEMHSPTTTKKMVTRSGGSGNSSSNSSMDCQASNSQLACEYLTAMQERNLQSQQKLAADAKEAVVKIFLQDNSYRSLLIKENEQTTEVIQRLRKKVGEVPMLHTGNLKKSMVPAYSSRFALALLVSSSPAISSSPTSSTTKPAPTEIVMGEHDVPLEAMKQKQDEGELVWLLKEVPDQKAFEELVAVIERYKKMDSDGEESEQTTIENCVTRFLAKEGAKELINDFINVLLKPHLSVVSALCSSTSGISQHKMDCIGNALIIVFANHRRLVDLFVKLCSIEVAHTVSITDLFLAGSMIGKMLPAYMKMALQPYLRAVLMPVTQLLFKLDKPLVLDPSITKSKEETKKCISKVKEICRVLIERLFASMPALPLTFRRICQRMHEIVINCWPTKRHIVVQSFLFTKFLCPALVSPQHFGLVDAKIPDKSVFRSCVLVSKTMQAIATGVYFGERERHMAALNKFVKECYPTLAEHFQTIIECKQHLPPTLASRTRMQSKTIGSAPLKDASNSAVNKTEKHIRSSWLSSSPQLQISTSYDSLDAQVRDRPSLSMNSQKRPSLEGPPRSISVECFRTAPKYVEPDAQKRKEREERRRRVEEIERKMKGLPNNTTDTKTQSPPGSPSRLSKSSDDHRYRPQSRQQQQQQQRIQLVSTAASASSALLEGRSLKIGGGRTEYSQKEERKRRVAQIEKKLLEKVEGGGKAATVSQTEATTTVDDSKVTPAAAQTEAEGEKETEHTREETPKEDEKETEHTKEEHTKAEEEKTKEDERDEKEGEVRQEWRAVRRNSQADGDEGRAIEQQAEESEEEMGLWFAEEEHSKAALLLLQLLKDSVLFNKVAKAMNVEVGPS